MGLRGLALSATGTKDCARTPDRTWEDRDAVIIKSNPKSGQPKSTESFYRE